MADSHFIFWGEFFKADYTSFNTVPTTAVYKKVKAVY